MIIQCESCSRKFIVKDQAIPKKGRTVECGYCSATWHQMPAVSSEVNEKKKKIEQNVQTTKNESLSVEKIKASDGKTYKFLGSQWAELLPSGKTGLFAKKKIGKELDKLTGRKEKISIKKKYKKAKKELDPSSENLENQKQINDIEEPRKGLGFLSYIFLIIIIGFSIVGVLRTFENDLLNYFPETQYVFELLNEQSEYFAETIKNMIVIVNDLISSY
tara:strand:- start:19 stop:672 length:654 start_codon:yes stop_codon:yes gene_type:complete